MCFLNELVNHFAYHENLISIVVFYFIFIWKKERHIIMGTKNDEVYGIMNLT